MIPRWFAVFLSTLLLAAVATPAAVAALGHDVLAQHVAVRALRGAKVIPSALVAFENFNLDVGKAAGLPGQDWCTDDTNGDIATYQTKPDAIVHTKTGVDESTGEPSSAAVAMGFLGRSSGPQ